MYTYNQLIFPSHMEKNTRFLVLAGFSLNGPVGTPFIIRDNIEPSYILGDCRLTENVRMAKIRNHPTNPSVKWVSWRMRC